MAEFSAELIEECISLCEKTLEKSYSPYSKFAVACVLITSCGQKITGCNVENASYGLTICAERTAVTKAISEGYRKFEACFVMTRSPKSVAPCGACRQFLAEFNLDINLFLVDSKRKFLEYKLRDLLPLAFTPLELDSGTVA